MTSSFQWSFWLSCCWDTANSPPYLIEPLPHIVCNAGAKHQNHAIYLSCTLCRRRCGTPITVNTGLRVSFCVRVCAFFVVVCLVSQHISIYDATRQGTFAFFINKQSMRMVLFLESYCPICEAINLTLMICTRHLHLQNAPRMEAFDRLPIKHLVVSFRLENGWPR